jgi:ATP-dependent RNA helicase DeaD
MILADCRMVVLDEADEMLSMGFIDDVRDIMKRTPWGKQTALFSATMPEPIKKLAEEELHSPEYVKIASKEITVDTIEQRIAFAEGRDKLELLERFIEETKPPTMIVFARTKIGTQKLADDLKRRGHKVRALHGDMGQGARDSVMIAFRGKRIPILVATDVASRGLDVSHVTHVVNYDLPDEPEVYVHRIGRTGRVGREGFAISFVSNKEKPKLEAIEKLLKREIQRWGIDKPLPKLSPEEIAVAEEIALAEESGEAEEAIVDNPEVVAERDAPSSSEPRAEGDAPRKRRRRRGGRGRGKGNGGDAATGASGGGGDNAPAPLSAD